MEKARPGDTIYIKSGTYTNIQLQLEGYGTVEEPIVVMTQQPGSVFIEGVSNLRLCGEYVEINGLHFRNGYTPKGAVIEFRKGEKVANNCRITDCVIDYFNPIDRGVSGSWILLYGRNNRLDHNSILGKLYAGVTLAVILMVRETVIIIIELITIISVNARYWAQMGAKRFVWEPHIMHFFLRIQ